MVVQVEVLEVLEVLASVVLGVALEVLAEVKEAQELQDNRRPNCKSWNDLCCTGTQFHRTCHKLNRLPTCSSSTSASQLPL